MRHPIHDDEPYAPHRRSRRLSPSPIRDEPLTRDRHRRDHPRDSHHRDSHRHHDTRHAPAPAPAPRHQDRPRRPSPSRMKTTPPAPSGGERSHRRTMSNSPPRPSRRHHNPDRPVRSETSAKHSSSGRDREAKRPPIQRSKTTKDMGAALLGHPRFQKAAAAALQAGAGTAFNLRRAPGSWGGEKGARVATAALGAAALDAFAKAERKKEASSASDSRPAKKQPGGVEAMGSALGGLLADQLARSGSKKKSRR